MHEKALEDLDYKTNSGQKGINIQYENHDMANYLLSKSNFALNKKKKKKKTLTSGVKLLICH